MATSGSAILPEKSRVSPTSAPSVTRVSPDGSSGSFKARRKLSMQDVQRQVDDVVAAHSPQAPTEDTVTDLKSKSPAQVMRNMASGRLAAAAHKAPRKSVYAPFNVDEMPYNFHGKSKKKQSIFMTRDKRPSVLGSRTPMCSGENLKEQTATLIANQFFQSIILLFIVLALYGVDITDAAAPDSTLASDVVGYGSLIILIFFTFEILATSWVKPKYFNSFYFWLDVMGTLSLLLDVPFIWDPIMQAVGGSTDVTDTTENSLALARAGKVARTGTRTTKALRVLRVVRIFRVVRLYRIVRFFARFFQIRVLYEHAEESNSSRLGVRLADLLGKRVIVGTIILLFVMPNLEVPVENLGPSVGIGMLERTYFEINATMLEATAAASAAASAAAGSGGGADYVAAAAAAAGAVALSPYNSTIFQGALDAFTGHEGLNLCVLSVYGTTLYGNAEECASKMNTMWYQSDTFESYVIVDVSHLTSQQAAFNMLLTTLLIFLLAMSSYLFNVDVRESVVKPIERTTRVIKKLAHTLFLLSHDDNLEDNGDDETAELFEGQFIDNITDRLNTFFNVDTKKNDKRLSAVVPENDGTEEAKDYVNGLVKGVQSKTSKGGATESMYDAIPETRVEALTSLSNLWEDEQALQFFKVFLTSEFAVESFLFVTAVDKYKNYFTTVENAIEDMHKKFVDIRAECQVNISDRERANVEAAMHTPTQDLFDESRREIFLQLERDNFPRFQQSNLAKQLIDVKKKQLKEVRLLRSNSDADTLPQGPRQTLLGAGLEGLKSIGAGLQKKASNKTDSGPIAETAEGS